MKFCVALQNLLTLDLNMTALAHVFIVFVD